MSVLPIPSRRARFALRAPKRLACPSLGEVGASPSKGTTPSSTLALASLLALVACEGQEASVEETAPSTTSKAPGDSVDLNQTFAPLIGGTFTAASP